MKSYNPTLTAAISAIRDNPSMSNESKIKQMRREKKKIIEKKKNYSTIYVEKKELEELTMYAMGTGYSKNQIINTLIKDFNQQSPDEKFTLTNQFSSNK